MHKTSQTLKLTTTLERIHFIHSINLFGEEKVVMEETSPRDRGNCQPCVFNLSLQNCTLAIPVQVQSQMQNMTLAGEHAWMYS